jgi:apolipoprotein N-acyltransferase
MALIGANGRSEEHPGRTTRSAFLVDAAGGLRGRYDKQILFPFSEYLPLDRATPIIGEIWGPRSSLAPGSHMTLFELPWKDAAIPFAVLLGAESAYPTLLAGASRRGARFVVNLVSEGDVAGVSYEQLARVCRLRAIENRTTFVLTGRSGVPLVIDPHGRVRGMPADTVPLALPGTTAYAASHDAFALLCVAVSLWLLARALLGGRATMTPIPAPAGATI